ncbi:MAG: hypothetical protein K2K21_12680 [Lachnospiraceae bacterium]|nr:hypothetical protein [Lachnospiraceae bacterium]
MKEFAKMIYEQWRNNGSGTDNDIDWGDYDEAINRIYDFLNAKIADELEQAINKRVWKVEENAFIAGFGYAYKCLSDGKIELKSGEKAARKGGAV